jgi:lipid-A-disaccharide synthase
MRNKRLQPWVGLPNILCQRFVVPELLQDQATPVALAQAVASWLEYPQRAAEMKLRFTELHQELIQDTSNLVTHAVKKIVGA